MWKMLQRALARLGLARAQPVALAAPSKKPEPYRWHAEVNFRVVTIGGETPSEEFKQALADGARKAGALEVHDHSTVRETPPAGWQAGALCAVDVLSGLRSGRTYVTNRRLTIEGVALDEAGYDRLRALRGGKGERGFSVSVAGVARPIPAAPLGPPPPEAMMKEEPAPPEEAPPKPKSKRAPRKTPLATRAGAPAASGDDQAAAEPAPKRTRSPRRKAVEAEAAPAESGPPPPEAETAPKPKTARKSTARKPAADKSAKVETVDADQAPAEMEAAPADSESPAPQAKAALKPETARKPATRKPAADKSAKAGTAKAEKPARKRAPAKPKAPRSKKPEPADLVPDAPAPSSETEA